MKKVLVLEDEANIRSFVVINLKRAGYEAIEADTGEEALAQLRRNPDIKVALLDIMLPDMDGFEVCRRIRASDSKIGIIMLTARTQEMDKITGLMTGADDYVTKPFSPAELTARIDALYRRTGGDVPLDTGEISQPPFLLVDLGTNAETVLCASGTLYACSAAAGPCFEGATLSCGMAGQDGAIDTVSPDPERGLSFTTIGDAPARGLCGSGVLDALALLLDAGIVDETGRLEADASPLGARITDDALTFTDSVRFTQKDIREVQLAKAAVRAGIDILLREAGMETADVARLYLAGGFGSAMRPESAARIGLIPEELSDRVTVLGNAAGSGALRYATEEGAAESALGIIRRTRYIELSAHAGFTDAYVERMLFPERE